MKLRQLTREDWGDISKLRFRDGKGEIIDVKIFDISVEKYNYPVTILYKKGDSYRFRAWRSTAFQNVQI